MGGMRKLGQKAAAAVASSLDAVAIGLVVTDPSRPSHEVAAVNVAFTDITGLAADQAVGRPLGSVLAAIGGAEALWVLEAVADGAPSASVELTVGRPDGLTVRLVLELRPSPDAGGLVAVLTDATERYDAELILRESEAGLAALTEAIPLPLLTVTADCVIAHASGAAHEALGEAPGAMVGRRFDEFAFGGDEGGERFCRLIKGGGCGGRIEMRVRRADGQPLWVLASTRLFTLRGEARTLVVLQDVSDLKRRELALTAANEEAERAIRARMRFLAAASHDLRQPLQALALFASALDHHVQTAQARTIVQSMKSSLRGMEEMFDSLMDMSKLDAGVMRAEPQVFLINDVFQQLEATYGPQAEAAGLDLRIVPSSAAVRSDPRLLARILGNFLSNAIRYTRRGSILLGVRHHGDSIAIAVHDTGPGIQDGQRLEIFREFHQGDGTASGRGVGMGLGLAIVQRLARLLNHRVDVHSVVGRGSCFAVAVPLAEDWCPVPGAEADEEDEDVRDVGGATVVVIDDDPEIQEGLGMILSDWGCQAVVADSAEQALSALERRHLNPDVILADLHLHARGDGVAAIRAVRSGTGKQAPAFLFTGDTEAPVDAAAGSFRILRKPLDPSRLRNLLADALGR